jgi:hypothetical protein
MFTDPQLVEALVAGIRSKDFTNIALGEAQSEYGNHCQNRDVASVARHVGA